ncbi:MAG: hypothetical protein ACOC1P_03000 [Minisyncoccales bacterium]
MKKRDFIFLIGIFMVLFSLNFILSAECNLQPTLLSQDPHPVKPGDEVDVVFQLAGVDNPDCNGARFEVVPEYPFSLDNSLDAKKEIAGSTFVQDYQKVWNIPYTLKIDERASTGDHPLKVRYAPGSHSDNIGVTKNFDISVEDLRVDFEVSIKSYDIQSKELTFEILNIGENNIKALTIEIPEQENIDIQGSPRTIVGYLDSGEETTFDFTAVPKNGEIKLDILYTDDIDERHSLEKTVSYNSAYFEAGQSDSESYSIWFYLFIALLVLVAGRWYWNKRKQKKQKKK